MSVTPTAPVTDLTDDLYKMRLRDDNFLSDVSGNNGRFQRGDILLVDKVTAKRWYSQRVADLAPPDAVTRDEIVRQDKDAEFERLARPAQGVFDQAVSRGTRPDGQLMPPQMPVPPRRSARRQTVAGAEIANGTDYDALKDED